jgi:hypothetical protein
MLKTATKSIVTLKLTPVQKKQSLPWRPPRHAVPQARDFIVVSGSKALSGYKKLFPACPAAPRGAAGARPGFGSGSSGLGKSGFDFYVCKILELIIVQFRFNFPLR